MSPISETTLQDLENQCMQDPEFAIAMEKLESGYQITRLRIQRGFSQEELAEKAGIKPSTIARLESGDEPPDISFLREIAKALGASVTLDITTNE